MRLLRFALFGLIAAGIWYGVGAFCSWAYNPGEWSGALRAILCALWIGSWVLAFHESEPVRVWQAEWAEDAENDNRENG